MNRLPIIEVRSITKEFPGVKALNAVNFSVTSGEIHALCGENGAGKSTLMKILSGLHSDGSFSGEIAIQGQIQHFKTTKESSEAGIAIVYQELSLVPELTVSENIFLGQEPKNRFGFVDFRKMNTDAQKLLNSLGLNISPKAPVKNLGIGEKQLIEIAKALSKNPKILILDEPTSALSSKEIQLLLKILKTLKQQGVSLILITHKLEEVFAVADRITILRDGTTVETLDKNLSNADHVISLMVGREIKDLYQKSNPKIGEVVLEVKSLNAPHPNRPFRPLLNNISWNIRRGEILGIAGLMGAGRTEMLMAIFGALESPYSISMTLEGKPLEIKTPKDGITAGLAIATEDRKRFGLILEDSVLKNLTLAALDKVSSMGLLESAKEKKAALDYIAKLKVKTSSLHTLIKNLSGGNQQKVVLSKCLLTNPKVLFLDEPTRGIDVGAKAEVYKLINNLANSGLSIVMVSSELPEILGLSDRIVVMCEGEVKVILNREDATQEKIMVAATQFKKLEE